MCNILLFLSGDPPPYRIIVGFEQFRVRNNSDFLLKTGEKCLIILARNVRKFPVF